MKFSIKNFKLQNILNLMLYYPVCKKYSQLYLKFGEKLKFWRLILSYQRKKYIYILYYIHYIHIKFLLKLEFLN